MKIIAVEGPNLTGKTTMVRNLERLLHRTKQQCVIIPEYVDYLGDQNKLPESPVSTLEDMEREGRFYISLEKIRQRDIAKASKQKTTPFILMDRTFFTCLAYSRITANHISEKMYLEYLNSKAFIFPDLIIFLTINPNSEQYIARKEYRKTNNPKCRGLSYKVREYSYIYRNKDYEHYFKHIAAARFKKIAFLDSLKTNPEDIYEMVKRL